MPPDDPSDLEPDDLPGLEDADLPEGNVGNDPADSVVGDLAGFGDLPDDTDGLEAPSPDGMASDDALQEARDLAEAVFDAEAPTGEMTDAELEEIPRVGFWTIVKGRLGDPRESPGDLEIKDDVLIERYDDDLYEDEDSLRRHDVRRLAVPGEHIDPSKPTKLSLPRWIFVGGGFGVLGLVLAVGFFLIGGSVDADEVAVALPSVAPVETKTPPSTEPVVVVTEAPAVALDVPVVADVAAAAFPGLWLFTATKTADLVLIPDIMDAGDVGIQLDLYVMVSETCTGDACTYTSVVERLDRFQPLIGTIPEATWVVDGTEWSLNAMWQAGPSECVQDHHFTYEFTVTETELIDGRTVPASFTGTWLQRGTGPCNGGWEHVAEWSVVGTAASG